ncbi:MAG TPA: CdaR family protein [Verrucomicrobiae bacterium]|nr:CdaR family protein [Verrucomicrobiae bacterium]
MPLRDIVVNNFWWKLLSLLLAALTWLTIETALQREQSQKHSLKEAPLVNSSKRTFPAVPITLMTSTMNTNRFSITPATTTVDISGPEDELLKLQEKDIHVYIDLSDLSDEKQVRRPIRAEVPNNLKVDNLTPANATAERISEPK